MRTVKRTWIVSSAVIGLLLGSVTGVAAGAGWWSEYVSDESALPAEVQEAVLEALLGPEGEYAAYATYAAIIDEYGALNPFASIMGSEANHISVSPLPSTAGCGRRHDRPAD